MSSRHLVFMNNSGINVHQVAINCFIRFGSIPNAYMTSAAPFPKLYLKSVWGICGFAEQVSRMLVMWHLLLQDNLVINFSLLCLVMCLCNEVHVLLNICVGSRPNVEMLEFTDSFGLHQFNWSWPGEYENTSPLSCCSLGWQLCSRQPKLWGFFFYFFN